MPLLDEVNEYLDKQHYPTYETYRNEMRQQRYQQRLRDYYQGILPAIHTQRENRGHTLLRQFRTFWREKEGIALRLTDSILPSNIIPFKRNHSPEDHQ